MRIVVTEYPKSGGTWVVSMLGDALGLPKRDIYYVSEGGYRAFDIGKHPWYMDTSKPDLPESCVIKSHERPNSPLIDFPAHFIHLVRDGRDVVVSKWFYESEFCVKNGIYERFDTPFDEYVPRVAAEWRSYVLVWLEAMPWHVRYEDFLQDPVGTLRGVLEALRLDVPDDRIRQAVQVNSREHLRKKLDMTFSHNTFVRKGIAGDWRNHFREVHVQAFKEVAGDALIRLGYERDLDW